MTNKIKPYIPGGKNKVTQKQYDNLPVTSDNRKAIIAGYDYSKVKDFGILPLEVFPAKTKNNEIVSDAVIFGSKAKIPDGSFITSGVKAKKTGLLPKSIRFGHEVVVSRLTQVPHAVFRDHATVRSAEAEKISAGRNLAVSGPSKINKLTGLDHAVISGKSIEINQVNLGPHSRLSGDKRNHLRCKSAFLGENSHIENATIETAVMKKNGAIADANITILTGAGLSVSGSTKIGAFSMEGATMIDFSGPSVTLPQSTTTYLHCTFKNIKKIRYAKFNHCQIEADEDFYTLLIQPTLTETEVSDCLVEDFSIQENSFIVGSTLLNGTVRKSTLKDVHFSGSSVSVIENSELKGLNSTDAELLSISDGRYDLSTIPIPVESHSLVSVSDCIIQVDKIETEKLAGSIVLENCQIIGDMPHIKNIEMVNCEYVEHKNEADNQTVVSVGSRLKENKPIHGDGDAPDDKPPQIHAKPERKRRSQEHPPVHLHEETSTPQEEMPIEEETKVTAALEKNMDAFEIAYERSKKRMNETVLFAPDG